MSAEKAIDPTESLWALFGHHLRFLRHRAGLTQEALGTLVHTSGSHVGQIETGERRPHPDLVPVLDAALEAHDMLNHLAHLAREAHHGFPDWFAGVAREEQRATRIRTYQPQIIPGLLQCEAYTRALFREFRAPGGVDEEQVAARIERQGVLHRTDPPLRYWAIIDEGALNRLMSTPDVAAAQLSHMLTMLELPNVVIEILPVSCGFHACMDGNLLLMTLPRRGEVAYVESMGDGDLFVDEVRVAEFERRYDLLRAETLSVSRSAQVLRELLEGSR